MKALLEDNIQELEVARKDLGPEKPQRQIFEKNSFDLFKTIAMTYHDVIQELTEKMNEINGSNAFARMECSLRCDREELTCGHLIMVKLTCGFIIVSTTNGWMYCGGCLLHCLLGLLITLSHQSGA